MLSIVDLALVESTYSKISNRSNSLKVDKGILSLAADRALASIQEREGNTKKVRSMLGKLNYIKMQGKLNERRLHEEQEDKRRRQREKAESEGAV